MEGFRLEPRRLLDGADDGGGDPPPEDIQVLDALDFEDDTPTYVSDAETAEADVTTLTSFAPNLDMTAHGVTAPTMEQILQEVEKGRTVALANINDAINTTVDLTNKTIRYRDNLQTRLNAYNAELADDLPAGYAFRLRAEIALYKTIIEFSNGIVWGLNNSKERLETIKRQTNTTFDIMKSRIKALYIATADNEEPTISGYSTDDEEIVIA